MPTSNIQLPEHYTATDILQLRNRRLEEITKHAQSVRPYDVVHTSQMLQDDITTCFVRKNCVEYMGPVIIEFLEQHKDRMARKRWAKSMAAFFFLWEKYDF
jgi:hypothetical protein